MVAWKQQLQGPEKFNQQLEVLPVIECMSRKLQTGVGERRIRRQYRRILNIKKKMLKDFSYIILAEQSQMREKVPEAPFTPAPEKASSFSVSATRTLARYFLKANGSPCRAPSPGAADTKPSGLRARWEPGPGQKQPAESLQLLGTGFLCLGVKLAKGPQLCNLLPHIARSYSLCGFTGVIL